MYDFGRVVKYVPRNAGIISSSADFLFLIEPSTNAGRPLSLRTLPFLFLVGRLQTDIIFYWARNPASNDSDAVDGLPCCLGGFGILVFFLSRN